MSMGAPSAFMKGMVKSGVCNLMIQVIVRSSPTLKTMASSKPMFLALRCWDGSSLSEIIEIKMILSTPNTISRKVRVSRLTQMEGSEKSGIVISKFCCVVQI